MELAGDPRTYGRLALEHFERPRNCGSWPAADDVVSGTAGSIAQGARFKLTARVAGGSIQAARFQAYGCPHSLASASWLTQRLAGCSLQALREWSWREVADALQVPTEKRGRMLLLEDAVRALASDWDRKA